MTTREYLAEFEAFRAARGGVTQYEVYREMRETNDLLVTALIEARAQLDHDVPASCYATGPLTGDPIEDLVVCPGCRAITNIDAVIAKARGAQ